MPAGFDAEGLPLAVQLVGRPGDEATLLSLAAQLEPARPWADARPRPAVSAERAARRRAWRRRAPSAAVLLALLRHGGARSTAKTTPTDLVSEADLEAERAIRALLAARRPDDAILGEEGGDVRGLERAALGRRPARRDRQLPVPRSRSGACRVACEERSVRRRARPAARRAVRRARRGAGAAQRRAAARVRARRRSPRRWSRPASATTPRVRARAGRGRGAAAAAGARHPPRSAAPRSTSPGRRPGATTPTTSAASTPGTGPRARCCAARPGLETRHLDAAAGHGGGAARRGARRSSTRSRRSSPDDGAGAQADGAQARRLAGRVAQGQLLAAAQPLAQALGVGRSARSTRCRRRRRSRRDPRCPGRAG